MAIAELSLLAAVTLTIVSILPGKPDGWRDYDNPRDPGFTRRGCGAGPTWVGHW